MFWEAFGSVVLGFALSWAAAHRLTDRLPSRRVVLGAGVLGALFGSLITHAALGPGYALGTLLGAVAVAAVVLSLLLRPTRRLRRATQT
ncbi:hypothetical protein [Streptomyces ficellus]|uniref:Uncharacterized protein n=1 Tax=Streptomyces ficellus TaxID=1977088 RepID=A0A6I6FM87_9ACTN|nr:hypothetical protein [Streptomyces ficellus]QGV78708.1 hypothetical protein EIZ62_10975 [Streptomyces ficellus]